MTADPVAHASGRLGHAVAVGDDDLIATARRDLAAAQIAKFVRAALDGVPPLTAEQASKIAGLLRAGR